MESKKVTWNKGLFLICQKCGQTFDESTLKEKGPIAENLKNYLRKELQNHDAINEVRVIPSGCLNVCIGGEQAYAFLPKNSNLGETEVFTAHPEKNRKELVNYLLKKIGK